MSYSITCDDLTIYDTSTLDLIVQNPKCVFKYGGTNSLTFNLLPNHPYYDSIEKVKSIITLCKDDEVLFKGRVLEEKVSANLVKSITCEGELAFFNDSIMYALTASGSISYFLTTFVNYHNTQCTTWIGETKSNKTFTLGNIETSGTGTIQIQSWGSTWEAINNAMKEFGGYLGVRYGSDGTRYLDYYTSYARKNSQPIELGYNIVDISKDLDGTNISTAVLPLGKSNLTVSTVNGGSNVLVNSTYAKKYGFICKILNNEAITDASSLLKWGNAQMAKYVKETTTVNLSAIDMNLLNDSIERFKVGDLVHVVSFPHNVDDDLIVTEISLDLSNPKNNKIKLESEEN